MNEWFLKMHMYACTIICMNMPIKTKITSGPTKSTHRLRWQRYFFRLIPQYCLQCTCKFRRLLDSYSSQEVGPSQNHSPDLFHLVQSRLHLEWDNLQLRTKRYQNFHWRVNMYVTWALSAQLIKQQQQQQQQQQLINQLWLRWFFFVCLFSFFFVFIHSLSFCLSLVRVLFS